ncbi:MAG: EVE domain-containing protein [Bacteroidales bacterium]|nr:EVE domain-containing protein [Bacteroidales bacterium]
MGLHICITNQSAWETSKRYGVYGNVSDKDEKSNVVWGKIRDLYAVKQGDLVIFYVKGEQKLYGVFKVCSEPYVCYDDIFGEENKYAYRFNFERHENFQEGIPAFEFYSLVEQGLINSIFTLERDVNASYRGIRQLSDLELRYLNELFYKYNPKSNPKTFKQIRHKENFKEVQATEFYKSKLSSFTNPTIIRFLNIPFEVSGKRRVVRYEHILHGCITNHLLHNVNDIRKIFDLNELSELILEAPILKSQQYRCDILTHFNRESKTIFYSFMEIKRDKAVDIDSLSQLIGYLKSFSSSRKLTLNSYEGIFVSSRFNEDVINYLEQRTRVEGERIVKLISYSISDTGVIEFQRII